MTNRQFLEYVEREDENHFTMRSKGFDHFELSENMNFSVANDNSRNVSDKPACDAQMIDNLVWFGVAGWVFLQVFSICWKIFS